LFFLDLDLDLDLDFLYVFILLHYLEKKLCAYIIMELSNKSIFQDFCDNTKTTFILNILAILMVFLTVLNPLNLSQFKQGIGKLIIIILLGYSLYITISSSYNLFNLKHLFNTSYLGTVRYNLLLNLVYCILIVCFAFYVFKTLFI